jgi:hypothetical protein
MDFSWGNILLMIFFLHLVYKIKIFEGVEKGELKKLINFFLMSIQTKNFWGFC